MIKNKIKKLFDLLYINLNKILYLYLFFVILLIIFVLRQGDDIMFHLQRVDAVISEIKHLGLKTLPIRIYHSTIDGYGYGSPMFYGDIFIWPFAILSNIFNISVLWTYKIMHCVVLIVSFIIAKHSFSTIFNKKNSEIATFMYMFSVTIFADATGSWLGRFFATMFVPLCLCSFYCLLKNIDKRSNTIKLSLGMAGLLYSNVIDAAIMAFVLLVILIFNIKKLNIRIITHIMISAVICLLSSAWFVFPMLEQMLSQTFFVTSDIVDTGLNDLHHWAIPIIGLFLPRELAFIIYEIMGLDTSNIPDAYFEGIMLYFVLFVLLVINKNIIKSFLLEHKCKEMFVGISTLLIFFVLFQTKIFPHDVLSNLIDIIQFPWRVNIVMAAFAAIITVIINESTSNKYLTSGIVSISILLTLLTFVSYYGHDLGKAIKNNEDFANYSYSSYNVGTGEYLPEELYNDEGIYAWGRKISNRESDVVSSNDDVCFTFVKKYSSIEVNVTCNLDDSLLELPFIYYKGYSAVDENGSQLVIKKSDIGLVEVELDKNYCGNFVVSYTGTEIQHVCNYTSLVFNLILVLFVFASIIKHRKELKNV